MSECFCPEPILKVEDVQGFNKNFCKKCGGEVMVVPEVKKKRVKNGDAAQ